LRPSFFWFVSDEQHVVSDSAVLAISAQRQDSVLLHHVSEKVLESQLSTFLAVSGEFCQLTVDEYDAQMATLIPYADAMGIALAFQ